MHHSRIEGLTATPSRKAQAVSSTLWKQHSPAYSRSGNASAGMEQCQACRNAINSHPLLLPWKILQALLYFTRFMASHDAQRPRLLMSHTEQRMLFSICSTATSCARQAGAVQSARVQTRTLTRATELGRVQSSGAWCRAIEDGRRMTMI